MKVAAVTGANSGMGKSVALVLANSGMHVVMLCRNEKRGKEALSYIEQHKKNGSVELQLCDLGSLSSVKQAAEALKQKHSTIDVLINNAGVVCPKRQETEDGFEMQMGVNHLGHFLLTNLLLDHIKQSKDGRIIVVSSGAHEWAHFYEKDPHLHEGYNVAKGYGQSKLCNLLFVNELKERVAGTNVSVFAMHPGAVSTNLGVDRGSGFGKAIHTLLRPFFLTPREGADTMIYLALSDRVKKDAGNYFIKRKVSKPARTALSREVALKCWSWSEKQTGLHQL
ncbi:SDR family oxidoreductase [Shouchella lehensis]|uniref:Dehydrogenase/reductase n=2 Tax=Shouchella lehensis TaxID=300825 RepID=A0A060LWZ1_9BACI|nr:SDR family oxidoreductase [Shouchella lehensis]AIC95791.1 dehydrogenase/reductase [Shouchella lehensis G1]MBG9784771.1 short-chain dehydrogenase [Shouchella lehensis]